MVNDAVNIELGIEAATGYVLERLDELSRCRLSVRPSFSGVNRSSIARLPLANPSGKVWVLTGVPKIGKTNAVVQLALAWGDSVVEWFDCPLTDVDDCGDEIAAHLVGPFVSQGALAQLLHSPARLDAVLVGATRAAHNRVVVVDNADRLPPIALHRLGETLRAMRRHGLLAETACIFVAARRLGPLRPAVDETVSAPAWGPEELALLLEQVGIQSGAPVGRSGPYLELLATRSGGHPLLAVALARKYPDPGTLALSALEAAPGLGDEDLSREAQQILYEDFLTDADTQNFVQRISVLTSRAPLDVLEALRTDVLPRINTTTAVLLDRVSPSVVEGSPLGGFEVAFVFREIAKRMIGESERLAVYRAVADRLLTVQGRVLIADRTSDGIVYALLSGDIDRAVFWTTIVLKRALDQRLPKNSIAALLTRLGVMSALIATGDVWRRFCHALMLMTFSNAYSHLGQYEEAADVLSRMEADDVGGEDEHGVRGELPPLRAMTALARANNLLAARRDGALAAMESLGPAEYAVFTSAHIRLILEVLAGVIQRERLSDRTRETVRAAVAKADVGNRRSRVNALRLAVAIGSAASQAEAWETDFGEFFPEGAFGTLLRRVSRGILGIRRSERSCGNEFGAAVEIAVAEGWNTGGFWSELQGHLGDAAEVTGDYVTAGAAYASSRSAGDEASFMWAWSSWRLGLLSEDVDALGDAARGFRASGSNDMWARALGARGAVLLKRGEQSSGIQCLAGVLEAYHIHHDIAAGPAATVAQAQLWRYQASREGRQVAEDNSLFPVLGAEPYERIIPTATPAAGPVVAFFVLGECFMAEGNEVEARRFLAHAMDATPENETDVITQPLAASIFIGLLGGSPGDEADIANGFSRFLGMPRETDRDVLFARRMRAEHGWDSDLPDGGRRLGMQTTGLEQGLALAGIASSFWEAEILAGQARHSEVRGEVRHRSAQLWAQALEKATASQNSAVMVYAGVAMGFRFYEFAQSFRQLARYQFECLLGAELGEAPPDFLGRNLFNFWRGHDYRRLSERDLDAKQMLMESAKDMELAATTEAVAVPAMVLLLARLHEHEGPATEWARRQLVGNAAGVPEDIRRRFAERDTS